MPQKPRAGRTSGGPTGQELHIVAVVTIDSTGGVAFTNLPTVEYKPTFGGRRALLSGLGRVGPGKKYSLFAGGDNLWNIFLSRTWVPTLDHQKIHRVQWGPGQGGGADTREEPGAEAVHHRAHLGPGGGPWDTGSEGEGGRKSRVNSPPPPGTGWGGGWSGAGVTLAAGRQPLPLARPPSPPQKILPPRSHQRHRSPSPFPPRGGALIGRRTGGGPGRPRRRASPTAPRRTTRSSRRTPKGGGRGEFEPLLCASLEPGGQYRRVPC